MTLIDLIGGYPTEWFVEEPASDFNCGVCLNVLKNPHQCQNGHTFCFSCISQSLKRRRACPTCSVRVDSICLIKSLGIRNLIDKLHVFCSEENCDWTGPLEEMNDHEHEPKPTQTDPGHVLCPLYAVQLCPDPKCSGKVCSTQLFSHLVNMATPRQTAGLIETLAKLVGDNVYHNSQLYAQIEDYTVKFRF